MMQAQQAQHQFPPAHGGATSLMKVMHISAVRLTFKRFRGTGTCH